MKRLAMSKNSVVEIKNLVVNTNHDPLSRTLDNLCVFIFILTLNLSASHTAIAYIIGLSTFDIYSSVNEKLRKLEHKSVHHVSHDSRVDEAFKTFHDCFILI